MKYKIWDRKELLYTPFGRVFAPNEVGKIASWAAVEENGKIVISANAPNCSVLFSLGSCIDRLKLNKVYIPHGATDEDILDLLEQFDIDEYQEEKEYRLQKQVYKSIFQEWEKQMCEWRHIINELKEKQNET